MVTVLLWLVLLVLCWPLALLALVLWPIVWLLTLPFRLLGIAVEGGLRAAARAAFPAGQGDRRQAVATDRHWY